MNPVWFLFFKYQYSVFENRYSIAKQNIAILMCIDIFLRPYKKWTVSFPFHSIQQTHMKKNYRKTEEQRKCRQQLRCARLMFSEISCRAVQCGYSIKSKIQTLSPPLQIDRSIKGLRDVGFLVTHFVLKTWTREREREGKEQSDCKSSQIKIIINFLCQLNYILNELINT